MTRQLRHNAALHVTMLKVYNREKNTVTFIACGSIIEHIMWLFFVKHNLKHRPTCAVINTIKMHHIFKVKVLLIITAILKLSTLI